MSSEIKAIHGFVRGRVQGVCFRFFTVREADKLDVTGYVRNVYDGSVEFVAEGDEKALRQLLAQIKVGPPAAVVNRVEWEWIEPLAYNNFEIHF